MYSLILTAMLTAQVDGDRIMTANGSSIYGKVIVGKLEIKTKYGKMEVPWSDIRSIGFGRRPSATTYRVVSKWIGELGSSSHRSREDATNELKSLGAIAVPQILASETVDSEVKKRMQMILSHLSSMGVSLDAPAFDLIETSEMSIKGEVLEESFKVKSVGIGEIDLARESLSGIFRLSQTMVTIDATGEWIKAGVTVANGDRLTLKAEGQVDIWPAEPGRYMTGPNGYTSNEQSTGQPAGALVYKIGSDTSLSRAGEKSQIRIGQYNSGELYFKVIPSLWNCKSAGQYQVTIKRDLP